ncbi:hypothetical protein L7F22_031912 [Adiantum nelumboides]|nr:hypothetical protein [Adiantum nelumboides]
MAAATREEGRQGQEQEQESKKEARTVMLAGQKSLLQSDALYQYVLETSVYPREPAPLRELREMTNNHPCLKMCLWLHIIAIDIHRQYYELGVPFLKKAGVHHKINFREGHGLIVLEELLQDEKHLGFFDFVFVDADKDNYLDYHERLIKLVKVGGLIGYDNTLWQGFVAVPDDTPRSEAIKGGNPRWKASVDMLDDKTYFEGVKHYKPFVLHFNKALAADTRIEVSMLAIGDGITLCRKITE